MTSGWLTLGETSLERTRWSAIDWSTESSGYEL
jgi:hypothetical protein